MILLQLFSSVHCWLKINYHHHSIFQNGAECEILFSQNMAIFVELDHYATTLAFLNEIVTTVQRILLPFQLKIDPTLQ